MVAQSSMAYESVSFCPDERNEAASLNGLNHSSALAFSDQLQHLGLLRPYRDDHTATLGELLDEAFRQPGSGGGDQDCVVGRIFWPAPAAVSHLNPHVAQT